MDKFKGKIACFLLLMLGLSPQVSLACTCANQWGDSEDAVVEAFCSVDVVFVGERTLPANQKDDSLVSEIVPAEVFKGNVPRSLIAESSTTCDHWYSDGHRYLIFGMIEGESTKLSTSICGPTRFTRRLDLAESLLQIVKQYSNRVDEVCSESQSTERRLRMLEKGRDQSGIEYDQLLEETRSIQEGER